MEARTTNTGHWTNCSNSVLVWVNRPWVYSWDVSSQSDESIKSTAFPRTTVPVSISLVYNKNGVLEQNQTERDLSARGLVCEDLESIVLSN